MRLRWPSACASRVTAWKNLRSCSASRATSRSQNSMAADQKALWADQEEGGFFTRIDVTTMLNGATLSLPLHVGTGRRGGPTFGIVTNTHGDEFLPTMAIREFLGTLDTADLNGRLAIVSIANP